MQKIIKILFLILLFVPTTYIQAKETNSITYLSKHGFHISVDKDFKMEYDDTKTIFNTRDNITTKANIWIMTEDISYSHIDDKFDMFEQVIEEKNAVKLNNLVNAQIESMSNDSMFKDIKKGDIILLNTTLRSDPAVLGQEVSFKLNGTQVYLTIYYFMAESKKSSKKYKCFTVYCTYYSKTARDKYTEDFNHALQILVPAEYSEAYKKAVQKNLPWVRHE